MRDERRLSAARRWFLAALLLAGWCSVLAIPGCAKRSASSLSDAELFNHLANYRAIWGTEDAVGWEEVRRRGWFPDGKYDPEYPWPDLLTDGTDPTYLTRHTERIPESDIPSGKQAIIYSPGGRATSVRSLGSRTFSINR